MIRPRIPRPRTLRGRLVLGATLLATVAVLVAQTIGFLVLHAWLLDRVDQQLSDYAPSPQALAAGLPAGLPAGVPTPPKGNVAVALPSDFRLSFYDSSGHLIGTRGAGPAPGPDLPADLAGLPLQTGEYITVPATSGNGRWRVRLDTSLKDTNIVVALPLATVDATTSKLLWLNAFLLLATVAALIVASRWVVRIGLLSLTRMERTAAQVTAGDLTLRLPDTDPRTETGRLSQVLNTMLDRLQGALREREASEARLRRFVADAGHELRTPLTSIQGFADLGLRHQDLPTLQRQEGNRLIAQNAARMRLLVEDLLLLARLDEEPAYRRESVDLLAIAADAVTAASVHRPVHPVSLDPLSAGAAELEVVQTHGDADRLRQVVGNLLTNALTHTPPGTPVHVRVGTGLAGAGSGGVDCAGRASTAPPLGEGTPICVIEVADEGQGLTAEQAERVFERFYRADPSRSRHQGGSGLGLAIAATIAEGHSGRLELDISPGHGSTFRLVLPRDYPVPPTATSTRGRKADRPE